MNLIHPKRPTSQEASRASLTLVAAPPTSTESARRGADARTYELRLSLAELAIVYKSLQASKTLEALPWQDELLNDTIQLVDQALKRGL